MQRGNPQSVRAHVTDHAVRRYAERALQETVDATVEDDDAIVELRRRRVPVGAIRRHLAISGGLGVANGTCAVVTEGLKLVIADTPRRDRRGVPARDAVADAILGTAARHRRRHP